MAWNPRKRTGPHMGRPYDDGLSYSLSSQQWRSKRCFKVTSAIILPFAIVVSVCVWDAHIILRNFLKRQQCWWPSAHEVFISIIVINCQLPLCAVTKVRVLLNWQISPIGNINNQRELILSFTWDYRVESLVHLYTWRSLFWYFKKKCYKNNQSLPPSSTCWRAIGR